MKNTVLITGTSSGIGKETAGLFLNNGWNVAATTRRKEDFIFSENQPYSKNILVDVRHENECKAAIENTLDTFGNLDVLINNAGAALMLPFEETSAEVIEQQFGANLFGPMNMTRQVLPYFRRQRKGMIVTVSSMGGKLGTPFYSIYSASKFAVEGFFESLWYELYPFGIIIKLVEPGGFKTRINSGEHQVNTQPQIEDYQPYFEEHTKGLREYAKKLADPKQAAQIIYDVCIDGKHQLRYPAGDDAIHLVKMRRELSDEQLFEVMGKNYKKIKNS